MAVGLVISTKNKKVDYQLSIITTNSKITSTSLSYSGFMSDDGFVDTIPLQSREIGDLDSNSFYVVDVLNEFDFDYMMEYNITFVKGSKIHIYNFENNKLRNVIKKESLPIIQKPGWIIPLKDKKEIATNLFVQEIFQHYNQIDMPVDLKMVNIYPSIEPLFIKVYRLIREYYEGAIDKRPLNKIVEYLNRKEFADLKNSGKSNVLLAYYAALMNVFYDNKKDVSAYIKKYIEKELD